MISYVLEEMATQGVDDARPVVDILQRAAGLLEGGWSPSFTRDANGDMCSWDHEGAKLFSITGALLWAAGGDKPELRVAEELVGSVVDPTTIWASWEADAGRTQAEVVALVRRAAAMGQALIARRMRQ